MRMVSSTAGMAGPPRNGESRGRTAIGGGGSLRILHSPVYYFVLVLSKCVADEDAGRFAFEIAVEFFPRGELQIGVRHLGPVAGPSVLVHAGDDLSHTREVQRGGFASHGEGIAGMFFLTPTVLLRALPCLFGRSRLDQDDVLPGAVASLLVPLQAEHHDDVGGVPAHEVSSFREKAIRTIAEANAKRK